MAADISVSTTYSKRTVEEDTAAMLDAFLNDDNDKTKEKKIKNKSSSGAESIAFGEGRLSCPKCSSVLGSFNWSGSQCSCGYE